MTKLFNAGKPWSVENDEQLRRLFQDKVDLQAVCLATGRTPNGIVSRMQTLGMLAQLGRYEYFRVEADPWTNLVEIRAVDQFMKSS